MPPRTKDILFGTGLWTVGRKRDVETVDFSAWSVISDGVWSNADALLNLLVSSSAVCRAHKSWMTLQHELLIWYFCVQEWWRVTFRFIQIIEFPLGGISLIYYCTYYICFKAFSGTPPWVYNALWTGWKNPHLNILKNIVKLVKMRFWDMVISVVFGGFYVIKWPNWV